METQEIEDLMQKVESAINVIRGKCLVLRITPNDFNDLDEAWGELVEAVNEKV